MIARFFLESFVRVAIGYEAAHGEEWARTSDPHEWATRLCQDRHLKGFDQIASRARQKVVRHL